MGREQTASPVEEYEVDQYDAVSSSIDHLVPQTDDPSTPCFTFRAILIGSIFATGLSVATAVWAFRTNGTMTASGATFAVVASYPIGVLAQKLIPKHSFWNPGPFSVKEHALIFIITSSCSVPYGMENVVSQAMPTLMGNKNISLFAALSFVFVTQFTGYGFAGLCRRFLVKPSAMIWPGIVGPMAILIAFHSKTDSDEKQLSERGPPPTDGTGTIEMSPFLPSPHIGSSALSASSVTSTPDPTSQPSALTISEAMGLRDDATPDKVPMPSDQSIPKQHTTSKRAVFWYSALGIFLYTHIPEYLLPGLQTISICSPGSYAGLPSGHMGKYNNVASTTTGIGLFGLTFDWYYISKSAPVNTPYWALVGSNIGNILISWIIVVCLFEADAWGASKISEDGINPILNSVHLYAGNPHSRSHPAGSRIDPTFFYDATQNYNLNFTAYDDVAPVQISSYFAILYACSFMGVAASVSHVALFYGKSILHQFRNALRQVNDPHTDVHNRLMQAYYDPPEWMYLTFALAMAALSFLVCLTTDFAVPWWGVILNFFFVGVLLIPVGVILAISNAAIPVGIIAVILMGAIIPGKTVSVMAFYSMTINNLSQALGLASDLKMGHYMHIPPLAMIGAQCIGTLINVVVSTCVTWFVMFESGSLLNKDRGAWQYIAYQGFYSDGAIWGAIGPARFFGVGSLYQNLLWCFLIGLLCPFIPWLCDRYIVKSRYWMYINFPIIFSFGGVGGFQNSIVMPLIVGFFFQVVVFGLAKEWYYSYAFVMGSGFDIGSGLAILTTAVLGISSLKAPRNALNPDLSNVPVDWYCYSGANYSDFDCSYYSAMNSSHPKACKL